MIKDGEECSLITSDDIENVFLNFQNHEVIVEHLYIKLGSNQTTINFG